MPKKEKGPKSRITHPDTGPQFELVEDDGTQATWETKDGDDKDDEDDDDEKEL